MKSLIVLVLLVILLFVGCSDEEVAETENITEAPLTMREQAELNLNNGVYEWVDDDEMLLEIMFSNRPFANEVEARYSGKIVDELEVLWKQFDNDKLSEEGLRAGWARITGEEMPDAVEDAFVERLATFIYMDSH